MESHLVLGQPSWRLAVEGVEAFVTESGGMLAPATFDLGGRKVQPYAVAPWAEEETSGIEPILASLRGDFFCMPFGMGAEAYDGEVHPLHGEPANERWILTETDGARLIATLETKVRPAKLEMEVGLRPGHSAVYQRRRVWGSGPVTYGMHATLAFRSSGRISTSPFAYGQVFPGAFEEPAKGGYTSLTPGAAFDDLTKVPLERGGTTDLTIYPARDGFEDLAIVYSPPSDDFAWSAVCYPEEGYAYWCLKDPRVLSATMFWISNGGRHYAPWSGRHRRVMGVEEVCTALPSGIAEALGPNPMRERGLRVCADLTFASPLVVSVVSGVVAIPSGFERVASIDRAPGGIALVSDEGSRVETSVDVGWLYS